MAMKRSTRELIELLRRINRLVGFDHLSTAATTMRKGAANAHRFHRSIRGRKYARDLNSAFEPRR
jgi:hypothetical protein